MDQELIALGYPFFVLLIVLEVGYSWRKGLRLYRFPDSLADLACGVTSQAVGALLGVVAIAAYAWVYQFRAFTLPDHNPAVWLAAFLYVDFVFYWWHRWSHEVHFLWAGHVVHHQSEDYNLAVALRQEWLTHLTHIPFYLPMALLGFSWQLLATQVAISLLYQFWIHTEVIRRMGPYEWLFNAPMHHRVHHAINPQYLDKNYGGILIIWDRLFGTYQTESEPCVYGTTTPIASWNVLWANAIVWHTMWDAARRTARWPDKLRVWFKSPAWSPPDLPAHPPKPVNRATVVKYDTPVTRPMLVWLSVQFLVTLAVQALLRKWPDDKFQYLLVAVVLWIVWAVLNLGGLLERKPWAKASELTRLALTTVACVAGTRLATDGAFVLLVPVAVVFALLALTLPFAARQSSPS